VGKYEERPVSESGPYKSVLAMAKKDLSQGGNLFGSLVLVYRAGFDAGDVWEEAGIPWQKGCHPSGLSAGEVLGVFRWDEKAGLRGMH
jgi:hypothetical protein